MMRKEKQCVNLIDRMHRMKIKVVVLKRNSSTRSAVLEAVSPKQRELSNVLISKK